MKKASDTEKTESEHKKEGIPYAMPKFDINPVSIDHVKLNGWFYSLSGKEYNRFEISRDGTQAGKMLTPAEAERAIRDFMSLAKLVKRVNEDNSCSDEVTGDFQGVWSKAKEALNESSAV